jgi:hypothetical protein
LNFSFAGIHFFLFLATAMIEARTAVLPTQLPVFSIPHCSFGGVCNHTAFPER